MGPPLTNAFDGFPHPLHPFHTVSGTGYGRQVGTITARPVAEAVRRRLGSELFGRVAGPDGPAVASRIHDTPGDRWFGPDRPIRTIHGDASMFIGGLRALLLQSLHPLAMAGVAGHSGYRSDPWGRLQRTSTFLAVTTYGTAEDAQAAVDRVRSVHLRVRGKFEGQSYRASDPHLLGWVHAAEVDSFLRAYATYGARPLRPEEADGYLEDTARIAAALGVVDPPTNRTELVRQLAAYQPELCATQQAREAARFLLLEPPLPWAARPAYALLAANAIVTLPMWARRSLRLTGLPTAERIALRPAGRALTSVIRWVMPPAPPHPA
jgi:uncharacterized protein (DUF2236 family)